jgi:hypothetical protein
MTGIEQWTRWKAPRADYVAVSGGEKLRGCESNGCE